VRFKPKIYWYTPFLIVGAAGVLILVLFLIIRRLARAAEDQTWSDAERLRRYRDPPAPEVKR
jgi:hypothetical protein